jgi:hypothetical protein
MDELAPTTSLDDDWCTVNEATRRLGVTATAIRNRLKRGTLETRPNGNFGRLVRVPRTVTLTPKEPPPGTVPLTPQERVTLTVLADHVTTLKAALAKLEAEAKRERARADGLNQDLDVAWRELALARVEAATVPALKDMLAKSEATSGRLESELALAQAEAATVPALRAALSAVRDERDRALTREHLREQRRFWRRLVGG